MSTHDKNIANDTFPNVRSDLNNALAAIASQQSGTSDPATMYAYERQVRTDLGIIRRRNAANGGWIIDGTLAEDFTLARSSDTILAQANHQCWVIATSTFTQTFTAAATLGDGWWCGYRNDGSGVITLDPNSTEQIDGASTITLNPGEACVIMCDGAGFKTIGRNTAASDSAAGIIELATQAEVNAMTDTGRAMTPNHNKIILGTEQATTSGTEKDFTGIPAGVRRITIMFDGVSSSGTDSLLVQIGDAGGIEDTGYVSCSSLLDSGVATANNTTGFNIRTANASRLVSGAMTLTLEDAANFTWVSTHNLMDLTASTATFVGAGKKALSAELTQLRIKHNGSDTFDAGAINISYER